MTEPLVILEDLLLDHLIIPDSALHLWKERMPIGWVDNDEIRLTLQFVYDYIDKHGEPPARAVVKKEIGWDEFEEPVAPVTYLHDKLKERFQQREVKKLLKQLSRKANDPQEVIDLGFSGFISLKNQTTSRRGVTDTHELESMLERYEHRRELGAGITFGFDQIDAQLGGFRKGELYYILGRPKRYKSWMLVCSAVRAWEMGHSVLLYTLELSKEIMQDRIGCMISGVSYTKFVDHTLSEKEMKLVKDAAAWAQTHEHKIHVVSPDIADRSASALIMQAKEYQDISAVYIDQQSYIQPEIEDRSQAQWYQIQNTCRLLKHASIEWPIIVAAQFNREAAGLNEMADLAKIGLSDAIGQTADMLFGLYASKEMVESKMVEFGVVESRNYGGRPRWHIRCDLGIDSSFRLIGVATDD